MADYCVFINSVANPGGTWNGTPYVAGLADTISDDGSGGWVGDHFSLSSGGTLLETFYGVSSVLISMSGGLPVPGNYILESGLSGGEFDELDLTISEGACSTGGTGGGPESQRNSFMVDSLGF